MRLVTLLVTAAVALTLTAGQAQQGAIVESLALQDTAKLRRKGPRAMAISEDPRVAFVEEDSVMETAARRKVPVGCMLPASRAASRHSAR